MSDVLNTTAPTPDNSATFSLEALTRVAHDDSSRAARRRTRLATAVPDAGGSGVIDVQTLREAGTPDDDRRGLGGGVPLLSAGSRLADSGPVMPPPSRPSPVLLGAVAVLSGAAIALGALAVMQPAAVVIEREAPSDAGTLAVAEVTVDPTEGDATTREPKARGANNGTASDARPETAAAPPPMIASASVPSDAEASTTTRTAKTKAKSRTKSKTKPKASAPSAKTTPAPTPTTVASTQPPAPKPKAPGDVSVDCIIDPASCKGSGAAKPAPTKPRTPTFNLPEKPTNTEIRNALARPKAQAKMCGEMHGAPSGTKVQVKLSIAGATGKVTSANPLSPHNNALGKCIATKLGQASFPRFSKPAVGVVYSVRL